MLFSLPLKFRKFIPQSATTGVVVYKTAAHFGVRISTMIMPWSAPILPHFSVVSDLTVNNGLMSVNWLQLLLQVIRLLG